MKLGGLAGPDNRLVGQVGRAGERVRLVVTCQEIPNDVRISVAHLSQEGGVRDPRHLGSADQDVDNCATEKIRGLGRGMADLDMDRSLEAAQALDQFGKHLRILVHKENANDVLTLGGNLLAHG